MLGTSRVRIRVELDHGAEALGRPDLEQQLVDELGGLGHHGDRDAGAGSR